MSKDDLSFFNPEDEMIRLANDHQDKILAGQFNWYCPYCEEYLEDKEVTFEETHDPRCGGCGNPVQGPPDPNDGPHDTLEEKNL